ncbi:MAG: tetratricopeptide repeat protein [Rhizomicrobium sp.]
MNRVFALTACLCFCVSLANAQQTVPLDQKAFDRGAAAFDAGEYQSAFAIFSDLAKRGDIAATRNVALMERKGIGTARDPTTARETYEVAAKAGLPTAQYDLAEMMIEGEGGPTDPQGAVPLLMQAADANHALAQYQLGVFYEEGRYVPRDLARAATLYAAAAQRGVWDAKLRLAALEGWPTPAAPTPAPGLQPAEPISPAKP